MSNLSEALQDAYLEGEANAEPRLAILSERVRVLTEQLQELREATRFDDAQHRRRAIDLLVRGSKFLHESWCYEVHRLLDDMRVPRENR